MSNQLGFEVAIPKPLDEAIETITALLKTEGFGILTRIDVRATLKEKIGADFRPYVILGACNPTLAHSALEIDAWLGLLLPCNVTVESIDDRSSLVRIANPELMATFSQSPEKLSEIVKTATRKLNNVVSALALA
ncbi:uncharacterized conserved protein [Longilinea arvoryzae]|uniref:Uncharacterized conserved protein n=1 Tax=Longilinea arvoryzae TaxID=360412 RepID=A0A0S7BBT5_9CHLR|nr:DUF302 domain-containing protein [Longilinea arvoryzae]GAP15292.1 uncharacterized conserved protein [Longilinea arvoryzae]